MLEHAAYALVVALRTVLALAPGYMHPDELFQSTEIAAATQLGLATRIPWEFSGCTPPARSVFPP
jgi:GPI mannosyltransferase 4